MKLPDHIQRREITVGGGQAGGSLGPSHFGLGGLTAAEVRVIWPDGSSETIVVGDPASSAGARLVEGSQERGVGNER